MKTEPIMKSLKITFGLTLYLIFYLKTKREESSSTEQNIKIFPSPGDLPNPGAKSTPLMSSALAGGFFTTIVTWEECANIY